MKRGDIWTVAGGSFYTTKPRPVLILQTDRHRHLEAVTICPFTSDSTHAPSVRIPVFPSATNGLTSPCWLMADRLVTVPREKLGSPVGRLDPVTLAELCRTVMLFLDLDPDPRGT